MNTAYVLSRCNEQAATLFGEKTACCSARDAAIYLAHTGGGESIRAIAAVIGTHPSTVMRTVRRVEERRDDPLLDGMLESLTNAVEAAANGSASPESKDTPTDAVGPAALTVSQTDDATLLVEARRFLRRLAEPDSFLMVASGAEKAGVFCGANRHRRPIAMLPTSLAAEFLRRDWIRLNSKGEASMRYRITDVGRAALRRMIAAETERKRGTRAPGFAEAASPFAGQHKLEADKVFALPEGGTETARVNIGESPLGWLARRAGPGGKAYLEPSEVEAGERLRSDFELAQMGPSVTQDWRKFLTPGDRLSGTPQAQGPGGGPEDARRRVSAAMSLLGPGLADVALRVCCFLEGLEACEKRMGWSARSGKVVLKLALQRLAEHYGLAERDA